MYQFNDLARACQALFGRDGAIDEQFLVSLTNAALKQAYRKRALATHPDRTAGLPERAQVERARLFREASEAYQKLSRYLSLRGGGARSHRIVTPAETQFWRTARERVWTPSRDGAGGPRIYDPRKAPHWPLRTGEYLYFSGLVDWRALIAALVWQRHQRETLGEIAARWGWLSETEVLLLLCDRHKGERLGDILMRHRLVSPFQLAMLLRHQTKTQRPLGSYFIEKGLFTEPDLTRYLADLRRHNEAYSDLRNGSPQDAWKAASGF
jgi:hypothetical protein